MMSFSEDIWPTVRLLMEAGVQERITSVLAKSEFQVIIIDIVKRVNRLGRSTAILAVTDRVLAGFNSKGTKQHFVYSWILLSKISVANNKIGLSWGKTKFVFNVTDIRTIPTILDVVQRLLYPSELKTIGFDNINTPKLAPTGRSFIARLKEEARIAERLLPGKAINLITSAIVYSQPFLDLGNSLECAEVVQYIIKALPLCETITDVTVRETHEFDVFKVLGDFAKERNHLKRLEVVGEHTPNYPAFMMNWKDNLDSELVSMSFVSSNFSAEHLSLLAETIIARKLKSVELHNAVNQDAMRHFYANFLSDAVLQNIVCLNLQGTKDLDMQLLLPRITSLEMLSLADCSLEIGQVMDRLARFSSLKVLDLSGNHCDRAVQSLPPCLHTLYVNNVTWGNQTLTKFMMFIAARGVNLSITNIVVKYENEWRRLFDAMDACQAGFLASLNWSNNIVSPEFFNFLAANEELTSLTLSGCLRSVNVDLIAAAGEYIKKQRSLRSLTMRGTKSHSIGQGISTIIEAVCSSSAEIEHIDLSYSKSGDFGVTQLRLLLDGAKPRVNTLVFDGLIPTTTISIMRFLDDLLKYPTIKVSFPHNDLNVLRKKNLTTIEEIDKMRSLFREPSTTPGFFGEACHVYRHFYDDCFPGYPTTEVLYPPERPVHVMKELPKTKPKPHRSNSVCNRAHPKPLASAIFGSITPAPVPQKVNDNSYDYNSCEPATFPGEDTKPVQNNSYSYYSDAVKEEIPLVNGSPQPENEPEKENSASSQYSYDYSSDTSEPEIPIAARRRQPLKRSVFARKSVTKSVSSVANINFNSSNSDGPTNSIIAEQQPEPEPEPEAVQVVPKRSNSAMRQRVEEERVVKSATRKRSSSVLQRRSAAAEEPLEAETPARTTVVKRKIVRRVSASAGRRSASVIGKRSRDLSGIAETPPARHTTHEQEQTEETEQTTYSGHPGWTFPIQSGLCFDDERISIVASGFSVESLIETLLDEDAAAEAAQQQKQQEEDLMEKPVRRAGTRTGLTASAKRVTKKRA